MPETKKIVCLANSRKHSGRCIAGKEILPGGKIGEWIRPVSPRDTREVSEEERRYENGASPKILDLISIPIISPSPLLFQSENFVFDARYYWANEGRLAWGELHRLLDRPVPLWVNSDSTYYGLNDRVRVDAASNLKGSLMLIEPENLIISVVTEGAEFGSARRRVRANFKHLNARYNLIVTDPEVERSLLAKPNADHQMEGAYLCISLGEPHTDGYCYKLAATVITKKPL